jgi:hypothetical protein
MHVPISTHKIILCGLLEREHLTTKLFHVHKWNLNYHINENSVTVLFTLIKS